MAVAGHLNPSPTVRRHHEPLPEQGIRLIGGDPGLNPGFGRSVVSN